MIENCVTVLQNASKEEIRFYLNEINYSQKLFPVKNQRELIVALLKKWDSLKGEEGKIVVLKSADDSSSFPKTHAYGILAYDWPGLADTCLGLFHERGWNVYFVKAFTLHHREANLGVILIGIYLNSPQQEEKLFQDEIEIFKDIKYVASGSLSKQSLIAEEIKKLRIYGKIAEKIKELYSGPFYEEIVNDEAVKFVSARSREYLEERRIEDLAKIIINNRLLTRKSLEEEKIQVALFDIFTTRGTFTAITVVGKREHVNLEEILRILEHLNPDHRVMFYKEFKTPEGLAVVHLEVVDDRLKPFNNAIKKRLENFIRNMFYHYQVRRATRIESIGGFEHYARAIIPMLIKEAENTEKPQVFLSPVKVNDFEIIYKLILVFQGDEKQSFTLIEKLQEIKGTDIKSAKKPKKIKDWLLHVIDIRVSFEFFTSVEEIYKKLKEVIKEVIGDFRDFDEGMRESDKRKFDVVKNSLENIPLRILRKLYFSLEDFYRISAVEEEIAELLKMGWQVYQCHQAVCYRVKPFDSSVLVVIRVEFSGQLISQLIEAFEEYEPILSRTEFNDFELLFLKLNDCESPEKVKDKLEEILFVTQI